jgi:hypothetical protein
LYGRTGSWLGDGSGDTSFPPLATGVLVEAGGFEFGPGDCLGEGIEQQ